MTPTTQTHNGITVVRDDLFSGGTKARYFNNLFKTSDNIIYATSSCGGAQVALAQAAQRHGKTAHIFVTQRKQDHPRTQQAAAFGATIHRCANKNGGQVWLNVTTSRAKKFAQANNFPILQLGGDCTGLLDEITRTAKQMGGNWDQVWCAAGTGTLSRALQQAFPDAAHYAVQVGMPITPEKAGKATIIPYTHGRLWQPTKASAPFPSCPHYDRKAWEMCLQHTQTQTPGQRILFWNVLGDLT